VNAEADPKNIETGYTAFELTAKAGSICVHK
jgi:hypothetical protein